MTSYLTTTGLFGGLALLSIYLGLDCSRTSGWFARVGAVLTLLLTVGFIVLAVTATPLMDLLPK